MRNTVSLAVLFAAAGVFGACAHATTAIDEETGAGGSGGDTTSGPGTSGSGTSASGTSGSGTSGSGTSGSGASGSGASGSGASGSGTSSGTAGQGGSSGGCTACDANAMCVSNMCVCNPGYTGDGMTCSDIDECAMNPNICGTGGMCTNEPGSYSCMCAPGYQDQGGMCVDIDECANGGGGCAAGCSCINNMGGPPSCDCILTQSNSQTIVSGNSVSCNNGGTEHTDNSYYRVFDLGALGINGAFSVNQVEMGVELATSLGGTQTAQVKLHQLNGAFTLANLTSVSVTNVNVTDTQTVVLPFSVSGTAAASSKLVVEFFTPAGVGNLLFVGSNTSGETAPGYLRAVDCAISQPTTTAAIGYPTMHIVMRVHGTYTKP